MSTDPITLSGDWEGRSLASLMEHIVQTHHAFCRQEAARITALFKAAIQEQGNSYPELKRMHDLFLVTSRELLMHLVKEEQTLFPYIAKVETEVAQDAPVSWPPFGTVGNPIRMMVLEHVKTNDEMKQIRELSDNYTSPKDAGSSVSSLYQSLAAFDQDMQRHIHAEDDLLFPRAVELEKEACGEVKKEAAR